MAYAMGRNRRATRRRSSSSASIWSGRCSSSSSSSLAAARVTGSARSRRSWRSWCLDSALASPPWCGWCRGAAMAWLGLAPPRSGVCRRGRHGRAYLLDHGKCSATLFLLCLSSSSSSIPGHGFPPCGGAGLLMLVLCCAWLAAVAIDPSLLCCAVLAQLLTVLPSYFCLL
jgi:hypothetical protein